LGEVTGQEEGCGHALAGQRTEDRRLVGMRSTSLPARFGGYGGRAVVRLWVGVGLPAGVVTVVGAGMGALVGSAATHADHGFFIRSGV
jgi:hypothetical protein